MEEPGRASNDHGQACRATTAFALSEAAHGDPGAWGCLLLPQDRVLGLVVELFSTFFLSKTSNETRTTITCLHRWLNKCIALAGQVVRKDQEEAERLIDV